MKISRQEVGPKKRIIIAIGQSESDIALLEKGLEGRDDLLIISSPTYNENTLERLRGQVSGVTRFDILGHGAVADNKEHHLQSGPKQTIPTKNLFTKLREIVGVETPLTNVNLWSCYAGAAAKDVKELGALSTLISHADENYESFTSTTVNKIIAAETQTGRESFLDSFLYSPETVTFSYCPKIGGEVVKHTARRSSRAITVDAELSRHLEKEFENFSLFLTEAGLPTDDLSAANLSVEAIQKYQEEDILLSALRNNPERLREYFLAKDSFNNKKFNLNQIEIGAMQESPLFWAAENGHKKSVKVLIDCGADVNFVNDAGITALMSASQNGHAQSVKVLIENGANVNFTDNTGATALMYASQNGHTDVVKELILGGADVNIEDDKKLTALTLSVAMNHAQSVQVLIANGANVSFVNDAGITALMSASQNGYTDVAKELIAGGADVNLRNDAGVTALMYASYNGREDVVKELIAGGANASIADGNGLTALSYALQRGEEDPIYKIIKTSLDRPKVDSKQNWFSSQSSLIVGTPSTSITAMAATAFFAVAAAALFMWRRKGRYADQEHRPRAEVNKPLAEKTKKGTKKDKPKGGKAL